MGFCRNCGSEVPEGVKFCTNCGSAVYGSTNEVRSNEFNQMNQNSKIKSSKGNNRKAKREETAFEKFSKFFGIILLFIAIVDYYSDPPVLTIMLSLGIIAGTIFCLSQKYRLKGFTIVALILAVYCFFAGISQGKEFGFLKVPKDEDYAKAYSEKNVVNETPEIQIEINNNDDASSDNKAIDSAKETKPAPTADGVDPELKAFLDSYEEFMDEYIAFMKKYTEDPGNAVSMLTEYATIMEKYGDFAEKIEQYDEKEMSTEDAKYYLEVTTRVTQKMLEIYGD